MNLKDFTLKITYSAGSKPQMITVYPDDLAGGYECDAFSLHGDLTADSVKLMLTPKRPCDLALAELVYDYNYDANDVFFSNGYQSWTISREYTQADTQNGLAPLVKIFSREITSACGDYGFTKYAKNLYHGFTYSYIRSGDKVELFGSLNERTGYTVFYADMKENVFAVYKDVEGVHLEDEEYELFNVMRAQGTYDEVFDKYFDAYPMKHTGRVDRLVGYTSWYNYYQNINEEIILRDLEGIKRSTGANIFQIDDGYETKVGDWTLDEKKFPNGMRPIVDKIHAQGLKAGLWIAPFVAEKSAKLVKTHPEWFVKKPNGKMLSGGLAWGGCYALDLEVPGVKEYIKDFFDKVLDEWDFDMVKLDFLYATAMVPNHGKSRGQLMCEAMDFLRECCGDKIILGCGVPLGPSFGIVDACRIGSDAENSFKDKFVSPAYQETVSTRNAMADAIFRRHLNGRIWQNDPDVFFLRDGGAKAAKYNLTQKKLLAKVNHMFGSVMFVSDDIGGYTDDQLELLNETYKRFEGKILNAEYLDADRIRINYLEDGVSHKLEFHTRSGEYTVE